MKTGLGTGIVVAILLSVAVWLFGIVSFTAMLSMALLLTGGWTVVAGLVMVEAKDRTYYLGWGAVVAALSLSYFIELRYTIALILIVIVALILVNVYLGRAPKMYEAATTPPAAGGGTPAAAVFRPRAR